MPAALAWIGACEDGARSGSDLGHQAFDAGFCALDGGVPGRFGDLELIEIDIRADVRARWFAEARFALAVELLVELLLFA